MLQVLGLQVGAVQPLQVSEQRVMSGIRKQAARGPVAVSALGLTGDEQADLTVHGGLAKAVYAYPVEHYAFWREHRRALGLSTELNAAMDDPTAVRTMARSGFSGFYLAVDVPGSFMTGQAFEVTAGPRETPVIKLFKAVRAKVC